MGEPTYLGFSQTFSSLHSGGKAAKGVAWRNVATTELFTKKVWIWIDEDVDLWFIPILIVSNHAKNLLFKKFSFLSGWKGISNLSFSQGPGWSDFSCKGWLKRFEISEVRAISSWEGWSVFPGMGFTKMDEISHWFREQFEDWWFNEQFEDWEN